MADPTSLAETAQRPSDAERYAAQDRHLDEVLGFSWERYLDDYVAAHEAWRQTELAAEARRGLKAMALAPTLELYRILLAGERVPWMVLNYFPAMRYGLRHAPPDGRVSVDDFNDVPAPA